MKYAKIERERRFLLSALPADLPEPILIHDRYLVGTSLRLRHVIEADREVFKLTQKVPMGPSETQITTIYLSAAEFGRFVIPPFVELRKRRHRVTYQGCPWAIDFFGGPLSGLVLAETEAVEDETYVPLRELGTEVTEVPAYSGFELALHGMPM